MIRTIPHRRPTPPLSPPAAGPSRCPVAGEAGDTLIEVLISAVLVVLVVVATLSGLNSSNRATSLSRARSQADALAQEDEDQLRSEPIEKLSELKRTRSVTENGTTYTVTSTGLFVADATSTSSCNSTNPSSNYLRTQSEVTWAAMGSTKPVVETGVVSPPPGSTLIVQVTETGSPVQGATVAITGSQTSSLETSSNGCAIFPVLPGQLNINVSKTGYVDQNGYPNSKEDPSSTQSIYLPAEESSKQPYALGLAGKLEVKFATNGVSGTPEGDTFVTHNSSMSTFRPFGTAGTYKTAIESPTTMYPFPASSPYTVYAGTCEADLPTALNPSNVNPSVRVPPGGTGVVTVTEPPVNIKVMSGTGAGSSTEGHVVENATGYTNDTGCGVKRSFSSTPHGELPHPGLPFGTYKLCVAVTSSKKYWLGSFVNEEANGPVSTWTGDGTSGGKAVIYLGTEPSGTPANTATGSCP
jgi:Tfp pilus assembly protein PilV